MSNSHIIGTCEHCGGPVMVPTVWLSVIPPVPTCARCGATMRPAFGPVLPMNPRSERPDPLGDGYEDTLRHARRTPKVDRRDEIYGPDPWGEDRRPPWRR